MSVEAVDKSRDVVAHLPAQAAPDEPVLDRRQRVLLTASLPLTVLLGGVASLRFGQDANGDQVIAHAMWIWSLFNSNQDLSWAPAGAVQLTPSLWNVPWYFLASNAPAWVGVFYLGALGGVALWLAAAITWTAIDASFRLRASLALLTLSVAAWAPATRTEFGTTFGNLPTAIFVLTAVLLYLRRPLPQTGMRRCLVIGLLLGLATGMKLTNLVWLLALMGAVAFVEGRFGRATAGKLLGMGLASAAGWCLTGGYWALMMWQRFKNPLHPFYNGIFHSPYGWTGNIRDERFVVGWDDALLMPLRMTWGAYPSELPARDIRWALILEMIALALILGKIRRSSQPTERRLLRPDTRRFILAFSLFSWTTWLLQFGIARYLIPLELLSMLLIICLFDLIVNSRRVKFLGVVAIGVLTSSLVTAPVFPKEDIQNRWFDFDAPPLTRQTGLLVVVPVNHVVAHGVLALRDDAVAVRGTDIYGRVGGFEQPDSDLAEREIIGVIRRHRGPVISMNGGDKASIRLTNKSAARYGMTVSWGDCQPMKSFVTRWIVCPWTPQVSRD